MRLLVLTPAELTRDPRARRAATAAIGAGAEVVGLCGQVSGETPSALEGVRIVRVGPPPRAGVWTARGTAARAPVREARGVLRLGRLGLRTARLVRGARRLGRFDVVHANDLDTLPAAAVLARRWDARLVYDAHEIYSAYEEPAPVAGTALALRLEGALARRADAVVTVSEPIADELERRLRLARPPVVVLNAPDREEFELRAFDGPLRAVYQGGLGPGRDFADLVALSGARGVELTARILYADPAALRAVAGGELRIAEPVPQEHAVAALRDFEVGVVFDRPQSRNSELSLPNKLFEYLMGGLAVVAPALPGLRGVVEDEGVGVTVEPGDTAALGAALEELAADRPRVTAMRRRAREVALARFNAETQSGALLRAWGLA